MRDRIARPQACEEQRRAAADAEQQHRHTRRKAEGVAQAEPGVERQTPPQERDALEQDLLPLFRRFRADELRRAFAPLAAADEVGHQQRAGHRDEQAERRHQRTEKEVKLCIIIQDAVGKPDKIRDQHRSGKKADHAAEERGGGGIEQILAHRCERGIAHRLHRANERALLADHARHRCDAHQRRHQHEEQREDVGERIDDAGVVVKGEIAGVRLAADRIKLQLQPLVGLGCGVGKHFLRVMELLLRLAEALLGLAHAVMVFSQPDLQFDLGVAELLLPLLDLAQAVGVGRLGGVQLRLGGVELRLGSVQFPRAGFQLGRGGIKLGKAGSDLLLSGGKLGLLRSKARLDFGELRLGCGKLRLSFAKLGAQRRSRLLPVRERFGGGDCVLQRGDLALDDRDALQRRRHARRLVGLELRRADGKLRLCGGKGGVSGLQLRAALLKLAAFSLQEGAVFLDLATRAGDLRHAGVQGGESAVKLCLPRVELRTAVHELLHCVGKLLLGVLLFGAILLPGLVKLFSAVGKLFVRLGAQSAAARGAKPVLQLLDAALHALVSIVVFLRIQRAAEIAPEEDLMPDVGIKGLGQNIEKAVDPPRAERGVAAVGADITGRARKPHDLEAPAFEERERVFVVVWRERERRAEILLAPEAAVSDALSGVSRQVAGRQLRHVDRLRQAHDVGDGLLAALRQIYVGKAGALRRLDARER